MTDFDPLRGDFMRCPAPPALGGGLRPTEWLESMAAADDKKKAHARAREARAIADWLTRLGRWVVSEQLCDVPPAIAMEAQRGGTPKSDPTAEGGDSAGLEETSPNPNRRGRLDA